MFFMIKLQAREMKNLSRILIGLLCFAPFAYASAAPVATTNGSNLTSFNPSTAYNNQWASMSNGRYDSNATAKADFKNCEAVVTRCASPSCSKGGCTDITVAGAIVNGCVQSNESCKQYGQDLINSVAAQLVASSNAKINEQNVAAQQAASQQSQQQIQQMQYQMQQMQQQMADQQEQSQQQIQAALAQQAAQSQNAIESMRVAATDAAKQNEAGISAYQQEAINRGISNDVLERQKIGGQVLTELEDANVSLKEVKAAMETAFAYAKCDTHGNNCEGPKRVKKWRELAQEFIDPYYNTVEKVYGALQTAESAGVDMSQIYMMLSDSCNSWGQYLCPYLDGGVINYNFDSNGSKSRPEVCPKQVSDAYIYCYSSCMSQPGVTSDSVCEKTCQTMKQMSGDCLPCTMIKTLTKDSEVYDGWVNAETMTSEGNTTVVACASGAVTSSKLFGSLARRRQGGGIVEIDALEKWLAQTEPNKQYGDVLPMMYCNPGNDRPTLEKAMLSKAVPANSKPLCVGEIGKTIKPDEDGICSYINPIYAICDVHPYNAGKTSAIQTNANTSNCTEEMQNNVDNPDTKQYYTKIRLARRTGSSKTSKCQVIFCDDEYMPSKNKDYCEPIVDMSVEEWKKDSRYLEGKNEYDNEMSAMYGETREMVGLKVTVVSQQMYKLYEYLSATLRRLKIQLEKATLKASLEAAGAKTDDSSSGLLGGRSDEDKTIHLAGANNCSNFMDFDSAYNCLQTNVSLIKSNVSTNTKKACLQLQSTVASANSLLESFKNTDKECKEYYDKGNNSSSCANQNKTSIITCADYINNSVMKEKREQAKNSKMYSLMK